MLISELLIKPVADVRWGSNGVGIDTKILGISKTQKDAVYEVLKANETMYHEYTLVRRRSK